MDAPGLSILTCTIGPRILDAARRIPPPQPGVRHLISWQPDGHALPAAVEKLLADRPDINLSTCPGKGLSRNRNHALVRCETELAAISDDDVRRTPAQMEAVRRAAAAHPEADILCFRAEDAAGQPLKRYSPTPFLYENRPRYAYISSIEMVVRRRGDLPAFDERFGLGSEYLACGEEDVFLHEARRRGLRILFLPVTACATDRAATTGTHFARNVRVRRSKGAALCVIHGYRGAVVRCLKFHLTRLLRVPPTSFFDMLAGADYIRRTRKC